MSGYILSFRIETAMRIKSGAVKRIAIARVIARVTAIMSLFLMTQPTTAWAVKVDRTKIKPPPESNKNIISNVSNVSSVKNVKNVEIGVKILHPKFPGRIAIPYWEIRQDENGDDYFIIYLY